MLTRSKTYPLLALAAALHAPAAFAQTALDAQQCRAYLENTVEQAKKLEKSSEYQSHLAAYALYRRFIDTDPARLLKCHGDNLQTAENHISAVRKHIQDQDLYETARTRAAAVFSLRPARRGAAEPREGTVIGEGTSTTRMPIDDIPANIVLSGASNALTIQEFVNAYLETEQGDGLAGIVDEDSAKKKEILNAIEEIYKRRIADLATPVIERAAPQDESSAPVVFMLRPKDKDLHDNFWAGLTVELAEKTDLGDTEYGVRDRAFHDLENYLTENAEPPKISVDPSFGGARDGGP